MNTRRTAALWAFCALAPLALVLGAVSSCHDGRDGAAARHEHGSDLSSLDVPISTSSDLTGSALTVRVFYSPLPDRMPGSENDTPEQIALGRRLFFERGVSQTKTQACNDCHRLDGGRAGVDNRPVSQGAKGIFGDRNSPTVLNAGFLLAQFWDGRAGDLVEQAKGPVLNPKEMAMASEADVVARLQGGAGYEAAFARAFPGQSQPMTFDNIARAIAAFERTLVTPARFDRFVEGNPGALTREEKRGLQRFLNTGCLECHTGATMGGRLFEKIGQFHPYANEKDLGRYAVTHRDEDRYVFRVPSLRNVTLTTPYFHDGQVSSLREAVRQMAWLQLDTRLDTTQVAEVVRFLRTLEAERLPAVRPGPGE